MYSVPVPRWEDKIPRIVTEYSVQYAHSPRRVSPWTSRFDTLRNDEDSLLTSTESACLRSSLYSWPDLDTSNNVYGGLKKHRIRSQEWERQKSTIVLRTCTPECGEWLLLEWLYHDADVDFTRLLST
jgi:hypothetical protein